MYIKIFGTTAVGPSVSEPLVAASFGVKPRQILAILATRLGESVPKDKLAELLWEGSPPKSYVASLESYVCVLRRELGLSSGRNGALSTTSHGYRLDPSAVTVDLNEFQALVKLADGSDDATCVRLATQALDLVEGQLLASEPYALWAAQERAAFDELLARSCLRGATLAQRAGDHLTALRLAGEALKVDRLIEPAWLLQMRSMAALGRRAEALRCFAELRRTVRAEMGVEPGQEAHDLYLELLHGGDDVPGTISGRSELSELLTLLRQALEGMPGARVPRDDAHLSAVAAQLLAAA